MSLLAFARAVELLHPYEVLMHSATPTVDEQKTFITIAGFPDGAENRTTNSRSL